MSESTAEISVSRILTEDVLTIAEARAEIESATKKRPDKATIHRWIKRGIGGTKLEAIRLGREVFTSRQALTRFIQVRTKSL